MMFNTVLEFGFWQKISNPYKERERAVNRSLDRYKTKRNFKKSSEPVGKKGVVSTSLRFVIQQHAARAMHYDLRLEIEGVMVSWAVPKGPSLNPSIKRLAIMTEDHPIEYNSFEGIIPKGEYGAGPVIVWDRGTYKNIRDVAMNKALQEGRLEFFLKGKKLQGNFALVRTSAKSDEKSKWLLIKMSDTYADRRRNPVSSQPESVKSGKTIQDLKREMKSIEKKEK